MTHPALAAFGLSGGHQVHAAPLLLRPDSRAHQVFVGFTPAQVREALSGVFPADAIAWVDGSLTSVAELAGDATAEVVVAAASAENPGGLYGLVWVVDRLLGPGGCPWDQAQTHASLMRHLLEEAYELDDSVASGDDARMREEVGDVLLQPVMHAQMAARDGRWDIDQVASGVTEKLIARHPHVFGDVEVADAEEVLRNWDRLKQAERSGEERSILVGVPRAMPALLRALEVSKRAARCGFEWPDLDAVWDKLHEEERELRDAIHAGVGEEIAAETGDLLFTVVNIARWAGVEPEEALRRMLDRFTARFQSMERHATKPLRELTAEEWDALWSVAKTEGV